MLLSRFLLLFLVSTTLAYAQDAVPVQSVPPDASIKSSKAKDVKNEKPEEPILKLEGDEIVAPTLDADGNPIMLPNCAKKDKVCQKKRKALLKRKTRGMKITNGTLTVDGWTGKARLAYDISEIKFLYISSPKIGTVVIGMERFPGSIEQKNAFDEKTLTVTTPDGHSMQLASDKPLLKQKKPASAWILLDPSYIASNKYPTFGYGSTARSPYNWPGVRPMNDSEKKAISKAPPLPQGLEAKQMVLPCQKVAPGERPKPVKINGVMMTPPACPQPAPVQ